MANSSILGGISQAMANRNYRIYTIGAIPSLMGTWVQRMAMGWFAWELTGSGAWLGLIAFADLAPSVLSAPIAGAFADRVNRLRIVKLVQCLSLCQALMLATLTLSGVMTIELLFGLALVQGVVQGIHQPFRHALLGTIVTREEMTAAIGINSTIWNSSRLIGPAVSAVVILNLGVGATFLINAFSYVPMLIGLYMINAEQRPAAPKSLTRVPAEIMEGIRFVTGHQFIGTIMFMLLVFSFFGRATQELLPGFTGTVFNVGADGLAMLTGAAGLGSLFSGIWLSRRGTLAGLSDILIVMVLLIAASQLAFVATDIFWVSLTVFIAWGFVLNGAGIVCQSLVQATVPDTIRGRVVSLYGMLWLGTPALGAFVMGVAADHFGFRVPIAGGALVVLVTFAWALPRRNRLKVSINAVAKETS
ncbi:MAG: MFS transporter [Pseudomonadota bacterium]|nr:MFS transporter [Pseudomonadota bacterium]